MYRTFGEELLHFARATDSITETDFKKVREVVQDYLQDNFGLSKVEFLLETVTQGRRGLRPEWDDEDAYGAYPVMNDDDQPCGQNAFALLVGKPIWLVGANEEVLESESIFRDLWSKSHCKHTIPGFIRFKRKLDYDVGDETARMLIAIPLKTGKRTHGVLSCESDEVYAPNKAAKSELQQIADALSILHFLGRRRLEAERQHGKAIKELGKLAGEPVEFKTKKPRLFLAYGKNRDAKVLAEIESVLQGYEDRIDVVDWEKAKQPGDITDWITTEILKAKYMISYLSDIHPGEAGGTRIEDNRNVIFETGMFHALREMSRASVREWLPIREGSPEEAPFDFRTMQMVTVPRDKDGQLLKNIFVADLDNAVRELIATELSRSQLQEVA